MYSPEYCIKSHGHMALYGLFDDSFDLAAEKTTMDSLSMCVYTRTYFRVAVNFAGDSSPDHCLAYADLDQHCRFHGSV